MCDCCFLLTANSWLQDQISKNPSLRFNHSVLTGDYLILQIRSACLPECPHSHLVISFTEELESLGSLVHEDAIQMSSFNRTDLYGLLPPTHDLVGTNVSCKEGLKLTDILIFQMCVCVCLCVCVCVCVCVCFLSSYQINGRRK